MIKLLRKLLPPTPRSAMGQSTPGDPFMLALIDAVKNCPIVNEDGQQVGFFVSGGNRSSEGGLQTRYVYDLLDALPALGVPGATAESYPMPDGGAVFTLHTNLEDTSKLTWIIERTGGNRLQVRGVNWTPSREDVQEIASKHDEVP